MTLPEDILNHLANMPGQSLPVYSMQFPSDTINCVAVFPAGGGVNGDISIRPGAYTSSDAVDYLDFPGFQVQVRYTDTYNAYYYCELIRQWLDENLPTGYIRCDSMTSQPRDLTNQQDLAMAGGPAYRWEASFSTIKVRA